jgi:hypothetical protein
LSKDKGKKVLSMNEYIGWAGADQLDRVGRVDDREFASRAARARRPFMTFSRILLTSTILCFLPVLSPAGEDINRQERHVAFQALDTNGDGWISREEATKRPEAASNFKQADRDGDGRLSFAEFETVPLNRTDQPGKFRKPDQG